MNLPDGEQLIITIDRVVERDCPGGVPTTEHFCSLCHGTGKRSKRLRGWCEVWVDYDYDRRNRKLFYFRYLPALAPMLVNETREYIVAAFLKGELPKAIADNIEEVPDG